MHASSTLADTIFGSSGKSATSPVNLNFNGVSFLYEIEDFKKMITSLPSIVLGAVLLSSPFALCLSLSDIPPDTPVASIISSAKTNLAQGNANDALTYFDAAISRDPHNYLTIFQRGAAYLSLGKNAQASRDFDKVLSIRPDFEGALLQRAKIRGKNAEWKAARQDYEAAGRKGGIEISQLEEAHGAALIAADAEKAGNWDDCVSQAGIAIMIASTSKSLRQMRARCRFERGQVREGVSDLAHVLQISPGSIEPHLQMSSMMFYSLGDLDKGLEHVRKCLHSDPDSKACSKLYKREKQIDKILKQINALKQKRQLHSAVKLLIGESGLLEGIKEDVRLAKEAGYVHKNSPDDFYASLIELTCDMYTNMNNKKKAGPYCDEALSLNPDSLPGLLFKAQRQMDESDYEGALVTLNQAKEQHPSSHEIAHMMQEAQMLLKRSKNKDYYKVLNVDRDADDRIIKRQYRSLTKKFHPDKTAAQGVPKEQAEKKMAEINEAYEILIDPELRARFDRGDDPNSQEQQSHPFHGSPFGEGPGGQQFFFRQGAPGGGGPNIKFQQGFQFPPGGFGF